MDQIFVSQNVANLLHDTNVLHFCPGSNGFRFHCPIGSGTMGRNLCGKGRHTRYGFTYLHILHICKIMSCILKNHIILALWWRMRR